MKLRATYETEVFRSDADYIVINQTDHTGEEQGIVLSAWQARQIAKEIARLVREMPDNPSAASDE